MAWYFAGMYSEHEWKVFKDGPVVKAVLTKDDKAAKERPPFKPEAETFKDGYAFFRVDDGWLVSFNQGEFGAALYWFDHTGTAKQKISNHHVVAFFPSSDGVLAIQGLAHLSSSRGSIIRLTRTKQWEANQVTLLPEAPKAGVLFPDGRLLLVLSASLVEYYKKGDWETLRFYIKDGDWSNFNPNSVVLTDDERKAYIGMRQFVAEYDFTVRTLRFLIPAQSFLNKLPSKEEERIRKQYGKGGPR